MKIYQFQNYTPEQGDIVTIDFEPSAGREIQKRRPALVFTTKEFSLRTGFVGVVPITSKFRKNPLYVSVQNRPLAKLGHD